MRSLYKVFDDYIGDGKNGKVKKMYFFVDLSFQQGYKFICLKGQTARPNGRMVMQRTANP